jgi:hypothetical protein
MTLSHCSTIMSLVLAGLCGTVRGQAKSVTAVNMENVQQLFNALFRKSQHLGVLRMSESNLESIHRRVACLKGLHRLGLLSVVGT